MTSRSLHPEIAPFVLDALGAGVGVFSYADRTMIWCNSGFRKQTWFGAAPGGRRAEKVKIFDLFSAEDHGTVAELIRFAEEFGYAFDPERTMLRGTARTFPAEVKFHNVTAESLGHKLFCFEFIDLSISKLYDDLRVREAELRRTQAELVQASKMASLGALAGGLAHEINNPLAILRTSADLMTSMFEREVDPEKARSVLERMIKTTERIAKIVRSLRAFSGHVDCGQGATGGRVADLVDDVLPLIADTLRRHSIALDTQLEQPDLVAACQPMQLTQALYHLLSNACDAVAELPDPAARWIKIRTEANPSGEQMTISISDGGRGVPEDIRHRIMDPFFTTKDVGKGRGLGLSVAKGVADSNGGRLWLDPDAAHTTFVIELPIGLADTDVNDVPGAA